MHPLLFKIGPVPIHTYGFLIAIGFLIAVSVIRRLSGRAGLPVDRIVGLPFWSLLVGFVGGGGGGFPGDRIVALPFWSLLVGFVGARVLFVITRADSFIEDPAGIFRVWEGGLVFLGGPLAVVPFFIWY